jgi:hypothetical protein
MENKTKTMTKNVYYLLYVKVQTKINKQQKLKNPK